MGYRVKDSDQFRFDYESIVLYLVDILDAPSAATNLFLAMEKMREILVLTPEIRAISRKPTLAQMGLREYLVKNYVVLYRIKGDTVFLEHMFHGSQDYEAYV